MELRHLRYFLAVADEMNFGRAAKKLHISQPPLTKQIKNLEEELGVLLIERSRPIELTDAGATFYREAKNIIHASKKAVEEARKTARGENDTLTLGYMSSIMLREFPPFLREFHKLYPQVELKFVQMRSHKQYDALLDGYIDAGFVDLGIRALSDRFLTEKISTELILHERLFAALPLNHRFAGQPLISIKELRDDKFVALERHLFPSHYDKLVSQCEQAGFSPNIVAYGDQTPSVLVYVASGVGVYLAPECTISMFSRDIAFVPLKEKAYVDVHMITRPDHSSKSLHHLVAIAAEVQATRYANQAKLKKDN